MALDPVALLLARIRKGGAWPPRSEAATWRALKRWRAFADADRDALARIARWSSDRRYRVDDLGGRIREAWADHLFGEDLIVTPPAAADDGDVELLEGLVEDNDLTEECRATESDLVIPEGEAWWRLYVDRDVAELPLLEFYSRSTVAPLFVGKRLLAVALITVLEGAPNARSGGNAVFRHFEVHAEGRVVHVVHRGTKSRLGGTVALDAHPETEELVDVLDDAGLEQDPDALAWIHDLPMLMGRIINRRGRNPRLGISEFKAIEDQLLDLNEAASVGSENMRLVAKRRITGPASLLQGHTAARPGDDLDLVDDGEGGLVRRDGQPLNRPWFDAGEEVLVADPVNEELGKDNTVPFQVLEYTFDAEPLIAYKRDLVETALTRIGLAPEWVGVQTNANQGYAASGTALRLRLTPTTKASHGKGKAWDTELPRILALMLAVGALDEGRGGLGLVVGYEPLDELPGVARRDPLPEDPVEEATVESTLVSAGVRSVFTSVQRQHPDWDEQQVTDEVQRIKDDRKSSGGGLGGLLGGGA